MAREANGIELVDVTEAAGLATAQCAVPTPELIRPQPSKSRLKSLLSLGRA